MHISDTCNAIRGYDQGLFCLKYAPSLISQKVVGLHINLIDQSWRGETKEELSKVIEQGDGDRIIICAYKTSSAHSWCARDKLHREENS